MWTIYLDGEALHIPGTGAAVLSPKLVQAANSADSLTFTILQGHPLYSAVESGVLTARYTVERDGLEVSRGRIVSRTVNPFDASIDVQCEGELAYLNDSVLREYDFSGAPSVLFGRMLDEHNAQCDDACRIECGAVTVQDPNDYIVRGSDKPTNLMGELLAKTCNSSTGGWLELRRVDNRTFLDWLESPTASGSQAIAKGSNLLDIADELDGAQLVTAIMPIGAQDGDKYVRLPEGSDGRISGDVYRKGEFVYSHSLVNAYGWHAEAVEWNDVTTSANLRTRAVNYINSLAFSSTLTLSALDLSDAGYNVDAFTVGQRVAVSCDSIEGQMLVTGATWALDDPAASTFEFGSQKTLTQSQSNIVDNSTGGGGWSNSDTSQYVWHTHEDTSSVLNPSHDFTALAPIPKSDRDEGASDTFITALYNGYSTPRIVTTAGTAGQWPARRAASMYIFGGSELTQLRVSGGIFEYEQGAVSAYGRRYDYAYDGYNDSNPDEDDYLTWKWQYNNTAHSLTLDKDGFAFTGNVTINGVTPGGGGDQPSLQVQEVTITIPSTAHGTNAPNLYADIALTGYTPVGVMGYKWDSGTRQNFFHFYRMNVETDTNRVYISATNYHSTDNANGVIRLFVLMARNDVVPTPYTGTYQVTPTVAAQSLDTDGKLMLDDVDVYGIPRFDTSNQYGTTTIIGDGD